MGRPWHVWHVPTLHAKNGQLRFTMIKRLMSAQTLFALKPDYRSRRLGQIKFPGKKRQERALPLTFNVATTYSLQYYITK